MLAMGRNRAILAGIGLFLSLFFSGNVSAEVCSYFLEPIRAVIGGSEYYKIQAVESAKLLISPLTIASAPVYAKFEDQANRVEQSSLPLIAKQNFYRDVLESLTQTLNSRSEFLSEGQLKLVEWLGKHGQLTQGRHDIQDLLIKNINKLHPVSKALIRIELIRLLFEVCSYPEVKFTAKAVKFFNQLPIREKLALVNEKYEKLHVWAQDYLALWRPVVNLEGTKYAIEDALKEELYMHTTEGLLKWLDKPNRMDSLALNGVLGYQHTDTMVTGIHQQDRDPTEFSVKLNLILYRLLKYRIEYGLEHPDYFESEPNLPKRPLFMESSINTVLVVFSYLAKTRYGFFDLQERKEFADLLSSIAKPVFDQLMKAPALTTEQRKDLHQFIVGQFDVDVLEDFNSSLETALKDHYAIQEL